MLENQSQSLPNATIKETTPRLGWLKPILAATLSLLITGLGQAYNKNWKKALGVVFVTLFLEILFLQTGMWTNFKGFILVVAALFIWRILTAVDAAAGARQRVRTPVPVPLALTLTAVAIVIVGAALESSNWFYPLATFRAFRVPSGSMCPTICSGDRIIADMKVFRSRGPHRGEVVMFLFDRETALHVKRAIAIGGDQVTNSQGKLLVNGLPVEVPNSACGTAGSSSKYQLAGEIHELRVPPNQIFLIGDNLDNSYDSRFYGAVDANRARGNRSICTGRKIAVASAASLSNSRCQS